MGSTPLALHGAAGASSRRQAGFAPGAGQAAGAPASSRPRLAASDRLRVTVLQTPAVLAGNALGIALVGLLYAQAAGAWKVLGWALVSALLWALRLVHWMLSPRLAEADEPAVRRWRSTWRALVLAMGANWAAAVWLFWGTGAPHRDLVLLLVVFSYCLGSVQLLAMHPRLFRTFQCVVLLPTVLRVATDPGTPGHLELAGLLALLFGITLLMGRTHGQALSRALWLKARTDSLASQLRDEKAQADSARRQAEAASLAKTRFFAAASHDLRQPLHAVSLFAQALSHRNRDPEAARLVQSIQDSVEALEGLFSELLDISRLDSGRYELSPVPLVLGPLFERLRLAFGSTAFDRGLSLAFHGAHRSVRADPVALERILGNLLSNAVRYTDEGGIVVAARPRGEHVLLQVWDSGIGVPEERLPLVFEEFYRAHPGRPVAAGERHGLGLGLAIVARLVQLSGSGVHVRSRVGHGSVFSFLLPAASAPQPASRPASQQPGLRDLAREVPARAPALEGRQVVVVDDDEAVREGLQALLEQWGARVHAHAGLAGLEDWLAERACEGPAPDLLLLDHQLAEGQTGLQALARLRAAWPGHPLPAIVVTGAPCEPLQPLAAAHGFQLLRKPVAPHRLRALIAAQLSGT